VLLSSFYNTRHRYATSSRPFAVPNLCDALTKPG